MSTFDTLGGRSGCEAVQLSLWRREGDRVRHPSYAGFFVTFSSVLHAAGY